MAESTDGEGGAAGAAVEVEPEEVSEGPPAGPCRAFLRDNGDVEVSACAGTDPDVIGRWLCFLAPGVYRLAEPAEPRFTGPPAPGGTARRAGVRP